MVYGFYARWVNSQGRVLKSSGRLFQRAGAEVGKLRGPIVFVFVLGTRGSPRAVERRRERAGTIDFSASISVKYMQERYHGDTFKLVRDILKI